VKNIYVGNLGLSTSEEALRQVFAAFGPVNRVSIMTDRETGGHAASALWRWQVRRMQTKPLPL
jgi:hypothetical protein